MAVDILYEKESFAFYPMPGEVERGVQAIQLRLAEALQKTTLPVFNGRP